MRNPFPDPPALCGPLRRPRQMLAEQRHDGHKSIHDDPTAEKASCTAYEREAAELGRAV